MVKHTVKVERVSKSANCLSNVIYSNTLSIQTVLTRGGLAIGDTGEIPCRPTGLGPGQPPSRTGPPSDIAGLDYILCFTEDVKFTLNTKATLHWQIYTTPYDLYSSSWFPHPACNTADLYIQTHGLDVAGFQSFLVTWGYFALTLIRNSGTPAKLKRTFKFHLWGNVIT